MKRIIYILTLLVSQATLFTSCDGDFEEVNKNPNDPSVVPSSLLLAGTLRSTANEMQSTFLAGESASCWVQHLGKPVYNDSELYLPRTGSIQTLWNTLYSSVIKDASIMQTLAEEEGNSNMEGVSLVIQAFAYQVLTDAFGNIPMTEAGLADEGNTTPIYDDSKAVYTQILAMLDQAMVALNGTGTIDASQDLVYGGDYMNWKRYAASLKFRVLMRASADASFNVAPQLQSLVNSGLLFSSNAQEAKMAFLSASPNANPYFEGLVDGGRDKEWCLGEELVNFMLDSNDPRLPVYAQEVGGNGSGNGYVGKPAGIRDIGSSFYGDSKNVSLIGLKYLEATEPCYFMSHAQLKLLMAEAAERNLITGNPATYYAEGILASFETNGVDQGSFALGYGGGATGLQQIAEQSWVALYMQGYEAFAEYRRTGFPVLPLAIDAEESEIPSRLTYPLDEQSLNNANYTTAVSAQGPDVLTTSLWWTK